MYKKLIVFTLVVAGFAGVLKTDLALGLSGADWRAGRIIDMGVFRDSTTMNITEIQTFLNAKMPECDTWGTKASEYGGGTRAQYGTSKGYPPPYTCLKDYVQNGKPAAQIIYEYAQQYRINPQVLITLLQKEQTLVTDDWPWASQYRTATGYGCPDTAACDSQYYGFANQVRWAARMYQAISDADPTWYSPYLPGNNYIKWHPDYWNAATSRWEDRCGGSNVYIESRATAALYSYTPYQPNATALSNIYGGQDDGCSSYGNRNFWRLFSDWFGTTLTPDYSWQLTRQYVYTDATKSVAASLDNLAPGQRMYVGISVRNTGNVTWKNSGANPTTLGTSQPFERSSQLYDPSWLSRTRPALLKEASVAPGEVGTFEFWITAPTTTSGLSFKEYFNPLVEGKAWMPDIGLFYGGSVQPARYTWSIASQYAYTDSTKTTVANMNSLLPGDKVFVGFTAKNTGNMAWQNSGPNSLMTGTTGPVERSSKFSAGSSWLTGTRPALLKEASVAPGQTGTFEFWLTIPATGAEGVYNERFNLIANNLAWLNDTGLSYYMNVQKPTYTWSLASQYAYTDETKTTPVNMNTLSPGQRVYVGFTAKNTGNIAWRNSGQNALMLGTAGPLERTSKFSAGSSWLTGTRPALLKETVVNPGQIGTFDFWLTVPSSGVTGIYNERFNLIANNLAWLNDIGLSYYMNIR